MNCLGYLNKSCAFLCSLDKNKRNKSLSSVMTGAYIIFPKENDNNNENPFRSKENNSFFDI